MYLSLSSKLNNKNNTINKYNEEMTKMNVEMAGFDDWLDSSSLSTHGSAW